MEKHENVLWTMLQNTCSTISGLVQVIWHQLKNVCKTMMHEFEWNSSRMNYNLNFIDH